MCGAAQCLPCPNPVFLQAVPWVEVVWIKVRPQSHRNREVGDKRAQAGRFGLPMKEASFPGPAISVLSHAARVKTGSRAARPPKSPGWSEHVNAAAANATLVAGARSWAFAVVSDT